MQNRTIMVDLHLLPYDICIGSSNSISHSLVPENKADDDHHREATTEPEKTTSFISNVPEPSTNSSREKERSHTSPSTSDTSHASELQAVSEVSTEVIVLPMSIEINPLLKHSTTPLEKPKATPSIHSLSQSIARYLSSAYHIDRK